METEEDDLEGVISESKGTAYGKKKGPTESNTTVQKSIKRTEVCTIDLMTGRSHVTLEITQFMVHQGRRQPELHYEVSERE